MSDQSCPLCGAPMEVAPQRRRIRRGERDLSFQAPAWVCGNHPDLPGGRYVLVDPAQMRASEAASRLAWRGEFGEELPRVSPSGRPPGDDRLERRVELRMSDPESRMLDELRGDGSRSDYLRHLVQRAMTLKARLKGLPGVRDIFLEGEEGQWELQVVRSRKERPRTFGVEGTHLGEVEERALAHLADAPADARIRFVDGGLAWFDNGRWRVRHGPIDIALLKRVGLEAAMGERMRFRLADDSYAAREP